MSAAPDRSKSNGSATDNQGRHRVVVTGLGAITPLGISVPTFWESLLAGKSGAATITGFDASAFTTHFACEIRGFDPLNYLDRKQAQRLDRFAQYAVAASEEALRDAGVTPESMSPLARATAMGKGGRVRVCRPGSGGRASSGSSRVVLARSARFVSGNGVEGARRPLRPGRETQSRHS